MKLKIIVLLTFLIGCNSTIHAYTKKELETLQLKSAIVGLVIDSGIAITDAIDPNFINQNYILGANRRSLLTSLQHCPREINAVLSAALETDSSILLQLVAFLSTVFKISQVQNADERTRLLKEILKPAIPTLINTILFASLKHGFAGKKNETVRRILRVLIATTTSTATEVILDRLWPSWTFSLGLDAHGISGGLHVSSNWKEPQEIILLAATNLLFVTSIEVLGAIVAGNMQEAKA